MNHDERPTPEQMLARVRVEGEFNQTLEPRGRLKLFFGYAAGVGKTFAMLQAAQAIKRDGKDVVIGYVEPHARPETHALTEGLEAIPRLEVEYRGTHFSEFNLDAALMRRPATILVDELAHTNLPSMRHAKRWQDIEELLGAGIDVFSTVNVQHVESLNDVIAEISGVQVRETVPDEVFERADEVLLVDIPPDELLNRLKQGKIYIPKQAAYALEKFFRKSNLVALREIALRHTADRVHEEVETERLGALADRPWPTNERLLVCVGPSPTSAKVVRAAKRFADRMSAPWIALHVESTDSVREGDNAQSNLERNLKLAASLGAEVVQISGVEVSKDLLLYARSRNVTKIVVGKTGQHKKLWWYRRQTLVDHLLVDSGFIDVILVRGEDAPNREMNRFLKTVKPRVYVRWFQAVAILGTATAITLGMERLGFSEANLVMVFLLAVVIVASQSGSVAAIVASLASVLLFDILFTEPYYWIAVRDTQYLVTFSVMLIVGLVASTLTARVRYQAEVARRNERRSEALYRLSRRLAIATKIAELVQETERIVSEVFNAHAVIYLPDKNQKIRPVLGLGASFAASAKELAVAQWVLDHNEAAGAGTSTLPSSESLYLPLSTPDRVAGVIAIQSNDAREVFALEARQLLDTYATQIAFALERHILSENSKKAEVEIETEKLRSSLLAAVSHDLRTPLAAISGAATSLAANHQNLPQQSLRELLLTIVDESQRLTRLVENLLHMTRLSSGKVQINLQWQPLEEVIGSALHRVEQLLHGRDITITVDQEMLLVHADEILLETVLVNLIENAVKFSPDNSPIEIRGSKIMGGVAMEVADRGRGIPLGDERQIFDLFNRGTGKNSDTRGMGLGLSICSAIVRAHLGEIDAQHREGGGTIIRFTIPSLAEQPSITMESEE